MRPVATERRGDAIRLRSEKRQGAATEGAVLALTIVAAAAAMAAYSVQQYQPRAYMRLGGNALAPLPFIEFCLRRPTRCSPSDTISNVIMDEQRSMVEQVQREVNRTLAAVVARQPPPLGDWTDEVLSGACYEHALIKRSRLLDRGLPASALLVAVALTSDAKAHLVLVVVTDKGDYVLDNLHQTVVRWDELPYRWVIRSSRQNPQYWQTILSNSAHGIKITLNSCLLP